jgi:GTP pyrophosphokinase
VRRQYAGLGKEIVERLLAKSGRSFVEAEIAAAIARLGHKNVEDALAAVGRGELAGSDVLKAMGIAVEAAEPRQRRRFFWPRNKEKPPALPVRGVSRDSPLKIFRGTGAVPGERIVGIRTADEGIIVYPIFAKALEQFDAEPERWIDLTWEPVSEDQRFPARISVKIHNEVGALAQVAQVIGEAGANIDELQMTTQAGAKDFFDLEILVEVHDVKHLNEMMKGLQSKPLVSAVTRVEE